MVLQWYRHAMLWCCSGTDSVVVLQWYRQCCGVAVVQTVFVVLQWYRQCCGVAVV